VTITVTLRVCVCVSACLCVFFVHEVMMYILTKHISSMFLKKWPHMRTMLG